MTNSFNHFTRTPLQIVDGIPIFVEEDEYRRNYERISRDQLKYIEQHGHSPFMTEGQISQSETATAEIISNYVQAGERILDAGIGYGEMLKRLPSLDRHGVDISLECLKVARSSGISVSLSKLSELFYPTDYFDCIVTCDVLEHLLDLDASIAEFKRVLKPGGVLVVRVPNNEDLSSYISESAYKYEHVRTFTIDSLRLYLEKCFDFSYVEHRYCSTGFYINTQLLNPAPALGNELRTVLPELESLSVSKDAKCIAALRSLSRGMALSLEEQVDALICLRDHYVDYFEALAPLMVRPAELLAVFRLQSN